MNHYLKYYLILKSILFSDTKNFFIGIFWDFHPLSLKLQRAGITRPERRVAGRNLGSTGTAEGVSQPENTLLLIFAIKKEYLSIFL